MHSARFFDKSKLLGVGALSPPAPPPPIYKKQTVDSASNSNTLDVAVTVYPIHIMGYEEEW